MQYRMSMVLAVAGLLCAFQAQGQVYAYWSDAGAQNNIKRAVLNGTTDVTASTLAHVSGINDPYGVVADSSSDKLYWAERDNPGTIGRCDLNGSNKETVVNGPSVENPTGVALDSTHGYVYWVNSSADDIMRASTTGPDLAARNATIATVVDAGTGGQEAASGFSAYALAIDHINQILYWSNRVLGPGGEQYESIRRVNVASLPITYGDIETVVQGPYTVGINDLALDVTNNKAYWTDGDADAICRASYSGTLAENNASREVLFSGLADGVSVPRGIAVDPTNNDVYWVDGDSTNTDQVRLGDIDTGTSHIIINSTVIDTPYNLALSTDTCPVELSGFSIE